jgi:hypothetical protein
MDLVKAWGAALGTFLAGSLILAMLQPGGTDLEPLWDRVRYVTVPAFLLAALVTAVAAAVHRAPGGWRSVRHLSAVFGVPLAAFVFGWAWWIVQGTAPLDMLLGTVAQAGGALLGWAAVDLLVRRRERAHRS